MLSIARNLNEREYLPDRGYPDEEWEKLEPLQTSRRADIDPLLDPVFQSSSN